MKRKLLQFSTSTKQNGKDCSLYSTGSSSSWELWENWFDWRSTQPTIDATNIKHATVTLFLTSISCSDVTMWGTINNTQQQQQHCSARLQKQHGWGWHRPSRFCAAHVTYVYKHCVSFTFTPHLLITSYICIWFTLAENGTVVVR